METMNLWLPYETFQFGSTTTVMLNWLFLNAAIAEKGGIEKHNKKKTISKTENPQLFEC